MVDKNDAAELMPIKAKPYNHQVQAFKFACRLFVILPSSFKSGGVALHMEMGCGKTIVSIAIAGALYLVGKVKRMVIVAPLSILSVWSEELEKFATYDYSVVVLKGTGKKKQEQLENFSGDGLQIAIVNYESAWRIEKSLIRWNPDLVIADEAHKMKEARTSQSKGMHSIGAHATYRLLQNCNFVGSTELCRAYNFIADRN